MQNYLYFDILKVTIVIFSYEFTRVINDDFSFEEKYDLIKSMWEIAFADGNVDKYEEYVIRKVSDLIYISHPDFIESKQKAKREYENRKT